mgnify:CR=1 FL=1
MLVGLVEQKRCNKNDDRVENDLDNLSVGEKPQKRCNEAKHRGQSCQEAVGGVVTQEKSRLVVGSDKLNLDGDVDNDNDRQIFQRLVGFEPLLLVDNVRDILL